MPKPSNFEAPEAHCDSGLETELRSRGTHYRYQPDFPLTDVTQDESVQVRLGAELAPKASVDQYANALRNGATFPAVVVTEDGRLVDGNTRVAAYRKTRRDIIPAYILSGVSDDVLRVIAIEQNQRNGTRMKESDVRAQVVAYLEAHPGDTLGYNDWARRTGVSKAKIQKWAKVAEFHAIARRSEIPDEHRALSDTVKAELVSLGSDALIFTGTDLVTKANLTVREARQVIDDLKDGAKTSEAEAMRRADAQRTVLADRIASAGMLGKRPSPLSRYRMHLGFLKKNVRASDLDMAATPTERESVLADLVEVRDLLDAVIAEARAPQESAA